MSSISFSKLLISQCASRSRTITLLGSGALSRCMLFWFRAGISPPVSAYPGAVCKPSFGCKPIAGIEFAQSQRTFQRPEALNEDERNNYWAARHLVDRCCDLAVCAG